MRLAFFADHELVIRKPVSLSGRIQGERSYTDGGLIARQGDEELIEAYSSFLRSRGLKSEGALIAMELDDLNVRLICSATILFT